MCITEKRPVRMTDVMRILLQTFTSVGYHGDTAGGCSSWTLLWRDEERVS